VNRSDDHASEPAPVGGVRRPRRARAAAPILLIALGAITPLALAGRAARAAASAPPAAATPSQSVAEAPCATAAATAAAAAALVARHIYEQELSSPEVRSDRRQVEGFAPLLIALAAGHRAAVAAAVTSLVYSHTHVVRLRVSRGPVVLADVGGPYILAPVGGALRLHGRTVGRYLLSVQDDVGYVKLESRLVGEPLILRLGGRRVPLEGTLAADATALPAGGPVLYRGVAYEAVSLNATAFPSGTLLITLLVRPPGAPARGCTAIRNSVLGRIGERIWRRYTAVGAPLSAYVHALGTLTGALAYVRAGSRQLAGSTHPGPTPLPSSGSVRYHRRSYQILSFHARVGAGAVRVYQLLPG
jgi:hypothetical protein